MSEGFDAQLVRRGAITGAGAYVGGSILVFAFMLLAGDVLGALASAAPIASATFGYSALHGWSALADGSLPLLLFALIPAAILVGAGYSAASQTSGLAASAAKRGASVTVGYLSVSLVSTLYLFVRARSAFSGMGTTTGSGGVDVLGFALIVAFTGVLFPLAFGAVGGLLAQARGY